MYVDHNQGCGSGVEDDPDPSLEKKNLSKPRKIPFNNNFIKFLLLFDELS